MGMPHPSGVSHFWNDAKSRTEAATVFRAELRRARLVAPVDPSPNPFAKFRFSPNPFAKFCFGALPERRVAMVRDSSDKLGVLDEKDKENTMKANEEGSRCGLRRKYAVHM